jgi:hypothetical protein
MLSPNLRSYVQSRYPSGSSIWANVFRPNDNAAISAILESALLGEVTAWIRRVKRSLKIVLLTSARFISEYRAAQDRQNQQASDHGKFYASS